MSADPRRRSKIAALLRSIFYALAIAFAIGFAIGTLIRRELSRPVRYIGAQIQGEALAASALATHPGHIRDSEASILVPSHHEEQV
jgi:hypothetical protein